MKFWGVEVKPGEPLMVTPEDNTIHISQASLDCKEKMGETVFLSVNVDGTKLVIGTLSQDKFPQIRLDLFFKKNFELSHNCTKGSVHFMGYSGSDAAEEVPAAVPAPVDANRNAGAAVVKADSKPESDDDESEEVKPESDDDESYDDDDSEKGMDEDDSTDQRTVEAATQKSKRESDDDDDSVMGIAKKQKKVDENPSDEETQTDEDEYIGLCQPTNIGLSNLGHHITENDIMKFFESTVEPQRVLLQPKLDENGLILCQEAIVEFQTPEEAALALKLKGEPLLGEPAYLGRISNSHTTVIIFGFDTKLPDLKQQIIDRFHQSECGKVVQVFLPKNPRTLDLLGFAYVLLDQTGVEEPEKKLAKVDEITPTGEYRIATWVVHLKLSVCKAKMGVIQEGDDIPYLRKKDFLYIAELQKFLDTIPPDELKPESSTTLFSWRNERSDLFGKPGLQRGNDCWARGLSKGHSAALKLAGSSKDPVTKKVLLQGVDKRKQVSGKGLSSMKYAKHFMESSSNCKEMVIYKRPATDKYDDYEQFEETIISLLDAERGGAPLTVTIDFLPSYGYFEGKGIYFATRLDFMRRAHEKFQRHVLLLSGHGYEVIGGVKRGFWEFQESRGRSFGDRGFVKMARHQCIIKQASVLKV